MVTYAKISPKKVNPKDKAGNAEEEDVPFTGTYRFLIKKLMKYEAYQKKAVWMLT